ncbi:hypothetical protein [Paenibacillus albiflavus]|uniref:hypothetical protein n=1 Tax=Paenibacillus albiflavus TaxID=2545760 RepID=UPI00104E97C8|nr:hypothetical protein [Paenibacillus albiflavus]
MLKPELVREVEMPQLMRDVEIEQYVRCSGCYYRICSGSHTESWRQLTQFSVDQVIRSYQSMPEEARTPAFIMDCVDEVWTNDIDRFDSLHHYRQVKRISTKYLMQFLQNHSHKNAVSLYAESMSVHVEELELELSIMFHLIEKKDDSFLLRKYFVTDEPDVIQAYFHMSTVFSYLAFDHIPDRIEAVSLLNGKSYTFTPDFSKIQASLDYLNLLIGSMREGYGVRHIYH